MKQKTEDPTVKLVMESFNRCVDNLTRAIRQKINEMPQAAEPEKAYHVNKVIRQWFARGGVL